MKFVENNQIVAGILPTDLETAATGDYVSMKGYNHLTVLLVKGCGVAGDDPDLTFYQATTVAGGSAKVLALTEYWKKQAATDLTGTGTFTRVTQSSSETVSLDATSAEEAGLYAFEFDASDLDSDGGFDCVRVDIADAGSAGAELGAVLYILSEPRYAAATMPTAIAD